MIRVLARDRTLDLSSLGRGEARLELAGVAVPDRGAEIVLPGFGVANGARLGQPDIACDLGALHGIVADHAIQDRVVEGELKERA